MPGKVSPISEAFDLARHDFIRDPFPVYRRILAEAPVHWNKSMSGWVVARHADVIQCLRDPRLSANRLAPLFEQLPAELRQRLLPVTRITSHWKVTLDPPDHTRLRGLTNQAFSMRETESMRPRIQAMADELLDAVEGKGQMDVIQDLSYPLAARVIAGLLGITVDLDQLKKWSFAISSVFSLTTMTDASLAKVREDFAEMEAYLRNFIAERRHEPKDDLLSHLLAVQEQGLLLSEEELVSECMSLLAAGHETTAHTIALALVALLNHPEQMQKLRGEPSLIKAAVEEFMRYDSFSQMIGRLALEDLEIAGERISAGDVVWLAIGAANRDPAQFPEPDRFDIARQHNWQLSFGYGIHFCQGALLARLETAVAVNSLLRRMPALRLAVPADKLEWYEGNAFRMMKSLPVVF